jgi:hypothetical protein
MTVLEVTDDSISLNSETSANIKTLPLEMPQVFFGEEILVKIVL